MPLMFEAAGVLLLGKASYNMVIKWFKQYAGQMSFLLILIIALAINAPVFVTSMNIINVLRQISINMIVACGMTLILISGGIDLATGAVMALSGMVSAYLSLSGVPFIICLLAGVSSGALTGAISGFILANTNLPPFIVTYAMQSIIRGAVYVITAAGTARLINQAFLDFGGAAFLSIPYPVLYMIAVIAVSMIILNNTRFGRHLYSIGGNSKAAVFAGINLKQATLVIYTLSGILSAFAGIVLTSRNSSMQPSVGIGSEMDAIAAVVLGGTSMAGGKGTIAGTIIGALIIGIINNGLNLLRMDSFYQYIAKGVVILIAVYADDVKNSRLKRA